jgi:hypothetical protein
MAQRAAQTDVPVGRVTLARDKETGEVTHMSCGFNPVRAGVLRGHGADQATDDAAGRRSASQAA